MSCREPGEFSCYTVNENGVLEPDIIDFSNVRFYTESRFIARSAVSLDIAIIIGTSFFMKNGAMVISDLKYEEVEILSKSYIKYMNYK